MNSGSIYYLTMVTGPIFRDMRWKSEYREAGANDCPFMGDIDLVKYPGGNLCAYLGGFSVGRVAESHYLANKVWNGDYADDMRNDPINICREFICLDRAHSRYGTVVKAEELNGTFSSIPLFSPQPANCPTNIKGEGVMGYFAVCPTCSASVTVEDPLRPYYKKLFGSIPK